MLNKLHICRSDDLWKTAKLPVMLTPLLVWLMTWHKDQDASWCNGGARKSQLSYKLSGVDYLDEDKRFCNISKNNIAVQHFAPLGKNRNKIKNKILRAADVGCQTIKNLCQLASDFQCDWCEKKTCKKTASKTFTPKRLKGQGKINLVNFASDKKW